MKRVTRFALLQVVFWIYVIEESRYVSDDEFGEKTVSILLDGEESEMVFIDHPHVEMSVSGVLVSRRVEFRALPYRVSTAMYLSIERG